MRLHSVHFYFRALLQLCCNWPIVSMIGDSAVTYLLVCDDPVTWQAMHAVQSTGQVQSAAYVGCGSVLSGARCGVACLRQLAPGFGRAFAPLRGVGLGGLCAGHKTGLLLREAAVHDAEPAHDEH